MEDTAIIDLYWARSQQAIAESEKKYGPYCHTIARRILDREEDAEECVNDTWLHRMRGKLKLELEREGVAV